MAERRITFKELDHKLSQLEPEIAVKELRSAVRVAANLIKKDAQSRAPRDSGALSESLRVKTKVFRTKIVAFVMNTAETFYGMFIEFGTSKMAARPFMRPAAESQEQAVLRKMQDHLRRRLNKLVR